MRKIYPLLLLLLLIVACSKKENKESVITGMIEGLKNDTLYIYGNDNFYDKIDTIVMNKGKISHNVHVDTLVWTTLIVNDTIAYPLFLDKEGEVNINGNFKNKVLNLDIKGGSDNDDIAEFLKENKQAAEEKVIENAEKFIREHPSSMASIYIIDRYFVSVPKPDFDKIKAMVDLLSGEMKDRSYIVSLKEMLDYGTLSTGNSAPYFQTEGKKGESISKSDYYEKYLLVNFWASWDKASRKGLQLYRDIAKETKGLKNFKMLGVALDYDKKQWLDAIKKDTLKWEQASDLKGWEAEMVKQYKVRTLPMNILIGKYGSIEGINMTKEELKEKIKSIKEENKITRNKHN